MTETFEWLPYIVFFDRVFAFFVFTASDVNKIRDVATFTKTISGFRLIKSNLIEIVVWVLISLELLIVIFTLFGGRLLIAAFTLAIFLLVLFTSALIYVLLKGVQIRCNCFGLSDHDISIHDVSRSYLKNGRLRLKPELGANRWISQTNSGQLLSLYYPNQ
jgi:uncharacterized membrane protein YphA (DoxX/SURF4 family)